MARKRVGKLSRASEIANAVNSALGKPVLRLGSDDHFVPIKIPTGSLVVDRITGGGFTLGRHVELYGDECVAPETLVLNKELEWVQAGTLKRGMEIVGFDEHSPGGRGKQRCLRAARILSNKRIVKPCYEIKTDRGTTTVASDNHLWLTVDKGGNTNWTLTSDLSVDDKIQWFGKPWEQPQHDDAISAAYLAGLFDGEGWCDGSRVAFAQIAGDVLDYGQELLDDLGFHAVVRLANGNRNENWQPVYQVVVSGGIYELMKFMGIVSPVRLKAKWEGRSISKRGRWGKPGDGMANVFSVKYVGEQEVCAVGTSTRTLITDGLFSHNSACKSYIMQRTIALSQERGNLCAIIDPEKSFDPEWFEHLGGIPEELLLFQPEEKWNAEDAIGVMMLLAKQADDEGIEVIGVDSVAAMVTQEEMAKDPREEDRVASQARMMSRALRRITTVNKRTLFIWTNQEFMNIGYGAQFQPRLQRGGRALKYYATTRLELRKSGKVTKAKNVADKSKLKSKEVPVGTWIQARSEKDKGSKPYGQGMFMFDTENGCIDIASEIIHLGLEDEIISRDANSFEYEDISGESWRAGSEKAFKQLLEENEDVREEIIASITDMTQILGRVGD